MGKMMGMFCFLGGIAYLLYNWVVEQKNQSRRIGEMQIFLQKSIYAMEEEKIRIIDYFRGYSSREKLLEETLQEIANRLEQKVYPSGEQVWEDVFWENRFRWNLDGDTFEIMMGLGRGFFGKKRSENLSFLKKGLKKIEHQQEIKKEKDTKAQKVWIPVSMLGGIMLMIILV